MKRTLGVRTAALLVVASMVGTGVFTTTGFLVGDLSNLAVLLCWGVGGVVALFGALAYGELAAALPHNGGEYALLSRIYHPAVGFVAGTVSLIVGFAAPTAASAIAFGVYLERVLPGGPSWWPTLSGIILIVGTAVLHVATVRRGSRFQDVMTLVKVFLVVVFIVGGLALGDIGLIGNTEANLIDEAFSGPFAIGLVLISFAYTGWNAAAYVAGETREPGRNLPRALALGTTLVTALYLGLNSVFLAAVPSEQLAGKVDVAHIAAEALFGAQASRLSSLVIALGLVSTVGALLMTGPRIYEAMGRDHPALRVLATRREGGGPVYATALQAVVAIGMALTASFDALLIYVGVSLSLIAALTAAGVFVLRWREADLERPYRTWGHPFTTLTFLALSAWMMVHSVLERPVVVAYAVGTLAAGFACWLAFGRKTLSN